MNQLRLQLGNTRITHTPLGTEWNVSKGDICCKYTGETVGCRGISSRANLNGLGTYCPWVYPLKFESLYKLIGWGASPPHTIINTSPSMCSIKWIPPRSAGTALVSWVGNGSSQINQTLINQVLYSMSPCWATVCIMARSLVISTVKVCPKSWCGKL